jgi:hypothetical protein
MPSMIFSLLLRGALSAFWQLLLARSPGGSRLVLRLSCALPRRLRCRDNFVAAKEGEIAKVAYDDVTLHIGIPKTGTKTIQSFLDANRKALRRHRISSAGPLTLQSFPMTPGFWEEERLSRGLHELKQQAAGDRAKRIVWSNEGLSSYPFVKGGDCPRIVKRALPADRYRVVVYLRRQDHRIRSGYLHSGIMCKDHPGPVLPFDEWLHWRCGENLEHIQVADIDYDYLLQPWVDVFGHESIVVRVFEKSQLLDRDLLRDFCDAAELPAADCDFDVPDRNVSFNMELYDMLRMYNSVFEDAQYSDQMSHFMQDHAADEFFSRKFFSHFEMSPERRREILERCEPSNRKIAQEFLGRDDGVLFREPWPSPDEPYEPYSGLTMEKIVPIFLHMLQKHYDLILDLDDRVRRFEREAKHLGIRRDIVRIVRWLFKKAKNLVLPKKSTNEKGHLVEARMSFREPSEASIPQSETKVKTTSAREMFDAARRVA